MGVRHDGLWALLIVGFLILVLVLMVQPGAAGEWVGGFVAGLMHGYRQYRETGG